MSGRGGTGSGGARLAGQGGKATSRTGGKESDEGHDDGNLAAAVQHGERKWEDSTKDESQSVHQEISDYENGVMPMDR